jgi:pimeloyl-ACP methyl ester carboxylesterase
MQTEGNLKTATLLADSVAVSYRQSGAGSPFLLLHGGAGPESMAALASSVSFLGDVIIPIHPGFEGTLRPEWLDNVQKLAIVYSALIEKLDLHDIILVGNSLGGWLATELALICSSRVKALVLMDAVGVEPESEADRIINPGALNPSKRLEYVFYDAEKAVTLRARAKPEYINSNQKALIAYGGDPFMVNPKLKDRLPEMKIPVLFLWGTSDRIVTPDYGRYYSNLIKEARFELIDEAGHFPQVEQPEVVWKQIKRFIDNLTNNNGN